MVTSRDVDARAPDNREGTGHIGVFMSVGTIVGGNWHKLETTGNLPQQPALISHMP